MIFLRSLFFNIFLFGGIAVACIIALPLLFIKDKHMICAGKILSKYIGFLLKIFIDVKINFKGLENLKKFDRYFVASAHQSMFETFVYNYIIPNGFFVLKKELMNIPIFGLYLKKLKCIPIERGKITKNNLNFSQQILKNISLGNTLIIFPQGTRVPFDENIPLKKGAKRIYENLQIGCLPVKLDTGRVWPKNSFFKYPGEINFIFKDFIEPNLPGDEFVKKLENSLYS